MGRHRNKSRRPDLSIFPLMLNLTAPTFTNRTLLSRATLLALLVAVTGLLLGCAGIASSPQSPAVLSVSAREPLFVVLPAVPDSVDTLLSRIGWVPGRFAQELRKEIVFQFHKKGMGTVEDSAAKSVLALALSEYVEGGGLPSRFVGTVFLKTSQGSRSFKVGKAEQRAASIERPDPTVDNIRLIAELVVKEACQAPRNKKAPNSDFNPPMLMLF